MTSKRLHAVGPGEVGGPGEPGTLVEAVGLGRRVFLVAARKKILAQIDAGVAPAYLGRLVGDAERLDTEIRRMDAAGEARPGDGDDGSGRRSFDASAI